VGRFLLWFRVHHQRIKQDHDMARKCEICGKGTVTGNKVSHAKNRTRRTWKPNILKVRTMVGTSKTTMKVCTRCLRGGKVIKAQ
jgi:large subunit ribosomal protein L28